MHPLLPWTRWSRTHVGSPQSGPAEYDSPVIRRKPQPKHSLKGLKIVRPPDGVSLERVAEACRYQGSGYHRTMPGRSGPPRSKPRGTKCPRHLQRQPEEVERLLREAIRAGHCGTFEGGFPRRVWRRIGQTIFEARQGSPGSGEYHGFTLTPEQAEDFQKRNADF